MLSGLATLAVLAVVATAATTAGDSDVAANDTSQESTSSDGGGTTVPTSPASAEPSVEPADTEADPVETPAPITESVPTATPPPKAVMPVVAGLSQADAEQALLAAGLALREVRAVPSAQPVGTVLRQAKEPGSSVAAGTAVVLVVASPYPSVPVVVGKPQEQAVAQLRTAGFKVTVTSETRTSGRDGIVLSQSPEGAELAKPGSTITVVVAKVVRPVANTPAQNCTPGYRPCLTPAPDYDCAGGSGNGPEYAYGPIYVTGSDPYDLDAEGDGVACE